MAASAQTDPVKWSASIVPEGKSRTLVVKARIDKGWHIYSTTPSDAGPVATAFTITPTGCSTSGKLEEIGAQETFDKAFDTRILSFSDSAVFRQPLMGKGACGARVTVEYMSCNDMMCLPPRSATLSVQSR